MPVGAVVFMGQPIELKISSSVHTVKSDTLTLKPVVATRTFTTTISADDGDAQLIAETREGDDVIGFAVGPTDDVLVDSILDIKNRLDVRE